MIVQYKPERWKDVGANYGYSELVALSPTSPNLKERRTILEQQKDPEGNVTWIPVAKPWPLNSNGTKMPNANDVPPNLVFWPYRQSAWQGVPLT